MTKLSLNIENQFEVYNTDIRAKTDPKTLEIEFTYDFDALSKDTLFINTFSRMTVHWRGFVYFIERVNKLSKELKAIIDKQ